MAQRSRSNTTIGAGELMPEDAICAKCSYSLRGLKSGGRCPECGTPFAGGRRRQYFNDTMTDAPVQYLRVLAAGCWMLAIGGVVCSVCLWAGYPSNPYVLGTGVLAACVWWVGVFIVTAPRQTVARGRAELKAEWRRARPFALVGQAGWLGACALFAAAAVLHEIAINNAATVGMALIVTPQERSLRTLAWLAYMLGIAGQVPLCLILADLSDWASNTTLGDRFRDSAWMICAGVPLFFGALGIYSATPGLRAGPMGFVLVITMILSALAMVIGSLIFLAGLIRLAGMSLWAVSNAITGFQRDERLAERQREHEEELAARVWTVPPSPIAGTPSRESPPAPRAGPYSRSQGHYMPRTGKAKPYDLAPEDDQGRS